MPLSCAAPREHQLDDLAGVQLGALLPALRFATAHASMSCRRRFLERKANRRLCCIVSKSRRDLFAHKGVSEPELSLLPNEEAQLSGRAHVCEAAGNSEVAETYNGILNFGASQEAAKSRFHCFSSAAMSTLRHDVPSGPRGPFDHNEHSRRAALSCNPCKQPRDATCQFQVWALDRDPTTYNVSVPHRAHAADLGTVGCH